MGFGVWMMCKGGLWCLASDLESEYIESTGELSPNLQIVNFPQKHIMVGFVESHYYSIDLFSVLLDLRPLASLLGHPVDWFP